MAPGASIITLTTDFGTADIYAGVMKGVILNINPACRLVDITHSIPPQDISAACFELSAAFSYFPAGTVHLAVVDPGVGSFRRAVIVQTDRYFFVGPDNGLFSFALNKHHSAQCFELTNSSYLLPDPSATFHGRDVFAPAAAHLSRGVTPEALGQPIDDCIRLEQTEPLRTGENLAEGVILHTDRFGNLITGFSEDFIRELCGDRPFKLYLGENLITRRAATYAEAEQDEAFFLFGSSGYLEISVKNGSARDILNAARGDRIILKAESQ